MKKLPPILQNLIYITYLAELLPFILCLVFIKKIKSTELKVFFLYTATFAIFLGVSLYFKFFLKNPFYQLLVNRIFLVVEFTFLCIFFKIILTYKYKTAISIVAILFFLLFSFYDYYVSKLGEFSFIPLVIECLFFVSVIVYFFYEKIQYNISSPIYYSFSFWISLAFLIYFSGNFFLFLFSKSMYKNPEFRIEFTIIYSSVTLIKNVLLCIAILVNNYNVKKEMNNSIPLDIDLGTFNPLSQHTNL